MESTTPHIHFGSIGQINVDSIETFVKNRSFITTTSSKFLQLTNDITQKRPDLLILATDPHNLSQKTVIEIVQTLGKMIPTVVILFGTVSEAILESLSLSSGIFEVLEHPIDEPLFSARIDQIIREITHMAQPQLEDRKLENLHQEIAETPRIDSHDLHIAKRGAPEITHITFQGISTMIQNEISLIESQLKKRLQPACESINEDAPSPSFQIDVPNALRSINTSLHRINYYSARVILQTLIGSCRAEKEQINSQIVVDRILQNFAYQIIQHKLQISIKPLPNLYSNKASLERIFTNLISHAIHKPTKVEQPYLKIWAEVQPDETVFYVKHNGDNLIEMNQISIFEQPEEVAARNLGNNQFDFSLSMAKALVQNLGGQMDITSSYEFGTMIAFHLPSSITKDSTQISNEADRNSATPHLIK